MPLLPNLEKEYNDNNGGMQMGELANYPGTINTSQYDEATQDAVLFSSACITI